MFAKSDYATYHWVGGVYANDVGQSKILRRSLA